MLDIDKYEIEIIKYAYNSWFESVLSHESNEELTHKAKRFKYLIDWVTEVYEIEKERKANETSNTNSV